MNTEFTIHSSIIILGLCLILGLIITIFHLYVLYRNYKKVTKDYEKLCDDFEKTNDDLIYVITNNNILQYYKPYINDTEIITFAEYRYDTETEKGSLHVRRRNPKTNKLEPVEVDLVFQGL